MPDGGTYEGVVRVVNADACKLHTRLASDEAGAPAEGGAPDSEVCNEVCCTNPPGTDCAEAVWCRLDGNDQVVCISVSS
jgi:hypothetical protein